MASTVLDVGLIRRLLAARRPMAEIVRRSSASFDQIARIARQFPVPPPARSGPPSKWDQHHDELRRLHAEKRTARAVAAHFGVSRNSIISVWNRMGLRSTGTPGRIPMSDEQRKQSLERRRSQKAERARANRAQERAPSAADPAPRRTQASILASLFSNSAEPVMQDEALPIDVVPILTRDAHDKIIANPKLTEKTCRWYMGDPRQPATGFCPNSKVPGLSYCEVHAAKAYAPPAVRRPRAAAVPKQDPIPTFADAESD